MKFALLFTFAITGGLTAFHSFPGNAECGEVKRDPLEIIKRHKSALGIRSPSQVTHTHQVSTLKGMGTEGRVETWTSFPDRYRSDVDMGFMTQSLGVKGTSVWIKLGSNAPRESHDFEKKLALSSTVLSSYSYLFPEISGAVYRYMGVTEEGKKTLLQVDMIPREGIPLFLYLDGDSFLLDKIIEPSLIGNTTVTFSDYRQVNGIMIPYHTTQLLDVQNLQLDLDIVEFEFPAQLDSSLFSMPGTLIQGARFPSDARKVEVPFILDGYHIFLRCAVNDRFPVFALLDTGAGNSVIDSEFATELGLTGKGKVLAAGAGGTTEATFVRADSLRIGTIVFTDLSIASLPLREMTSKLLAYPLQFVIGYDILHRVVARIDYHERKLVLIDPDAFNYTGKGISLEVHLDQNIPSITCTVNDSIAGEFKIDTGSSGVVTFFKDFIEAKGILSHAKKTVPGYAEGVGGEVRLAKSRISSFSVGSFRFDDLPVELALENKGAFSSQTADGNIGGKLLSQFVLWLDFPRNRIILEKGSSFTGSVQADPIGFSLKREGDPVVVARVVEGAPGYRAGLRKGDVLLQINGVPVDSLSLSSIYEILKGRDHERKDTPAEERTATAISVQISRGEEIHTFTVVPSEYY
jgi:hypothetical protein